jgi:hypothetical protein
MRAAVLVLQVVTVAVVVRGYHLPLSETEFYHCWPLDANEYNFETIDCKGMSGSRSSVL